MRLQRLLMRVFTFLLYSALFECVFHAYSIISGAHGRPPPNCGEVPRAGRGWGRGGGSKPWKSRGKVGNAKVKNESEGS